jgi:hypothetical protein
VRITRLFMLLALLLPVPTRAWAQKDDGWWGTLERLSGPGPFYGPGIDLGLVCKEATGPLHPCVLGLERRDRGPEFPVQVIGVRFAYLSSGDRERFEDTVGDRRPVHVLELGASYNYAFHRAFDAGFAASWLRFSGEGFDPLTRFAITPVSVSLAPIAIASTDPWARVFRVRFEEVYITTGFTGLEFGSRTTSFSTNAELIRRLKFVIDFGALIDRK